MQLIFDKLVSFKIQGKLLNGNIFFMRGKDGLLLNRQLLNSLIRLRIEKLLEVLQGKRFLSCLLHAL